MKKTDESQSKDQQAPAAALQVINAVPVTTQAEAIVRPAVTTDQAIEAWNAYLELKRKIKTPDDVQIIEKKEFLKKSYWRKIATFFNLNVEKIDEKMQPVGNTILFDFTCKATAPNGRSAIGTGSCDIYEKAIFKNGQYLKEVKKWSDSLKKMVRVKDSDGNYKYEPAEPNSLHNTRTTAETRAFNRAVSNLVGGGEVSAEEIQTGNNSEDQDQQAAPKQAPAPAPAAAAAKPQATTAAAPKAQDTKAPAAKKDAPKGNVDAKKEAKEIPEGFKAEYDAIQDKLNDKGKRDQVCAACDAKVDTAVYYYAYNNWGKILCRNCQKKYADFKKVTEGTMREFKDWVKDVDKMFETIAPLLDTELSDEPGELEQQLKKIDAYSYRLVKLYAEAEVYLRRAAAYYLHRIEDETYKALEREVYLDDAVAEENKIYQTLKYLLGDRKQRRRNTAPDSLGQSLLANARAMHDKAGI